MGKGDIKTKRGKISKGTYGVRRPRTSAKRKAAEEVASETKKKAPKTKKKAKASK
jgi:30S ribosomal protein S31